LIRGDQGENVRVDLQMGLGHKGPSPTPRSDRGQSPQSRGSGPRRQCLYNGHVNQHSPQVRKVEYYTEGLIPYSNVVVGCTTAVTSFFLYAGAASSSCSTSNPKVWNPLHPTGAEAQDPQINHLEKNSTSLNPSRYCS
jgi:hypothetical protein